MPTGIPTAFAFFILFKNSSSKFPFPNPALSIANLMPAFLTAFQLMFP